MCVIGSIRFQYGRGNVLQGKIDVKSFYTCGWSGGVAACITAEGNEKGWKWAAFTNSNSLSSSICIIWHTKFLQLWVANKCLRHTVADLRVQTNNDMLKIGRQQNAIIIYIADCLYVIRVRICGLHVDRSSVVVGGNATKVQSALTFCKLTHSFCCCCTWRSHPSFPRPFPLLSRIY